VPVDDDGPVHDGLRFRESVRAVILDEDRRVLLVRFEFPSSNGVSALWAAPGGGVDDGEDDHRALARELAEEVGLSGAAIGPLIWTRTHVLPMSTGHDGQRERFYLVRTSAFTPRPQFSEEQLRAENVTAHRWWTLPELRRADTTFAPRRLPDLLAALLDEGPPLPPVDVGV
jgi:8-oxo-dGTP pyrophosphatase MutT (NUDIX family)